MARGLHVFLFMRLLVLWLWIAAGVFAADETLVNLSLRAQTDFDRVEISYKPSLPETMACVQSQAMMLPVTRPAELSLIYYRKGYCELIGANITNSRNEYRDAAHDFDKAIEAWPERVKRGAAIPPVSSGLRVLADAAHLLTDGNSDPRIQRDLDEAVSRPICAGLDMSPGKCQALVEIGKLWMGWIANREGRLGDAARSFEPFGGTGWRELVAGKLAMNGRKFPEAVASFRQAVDKFAQQPKTGLTALIGPRPDRADAAFRLGQAQFETRDYTSAIASLDEAVRLRPENARAMFARGRAREKLGQPGLADFELASRTAFANVNAPGAGGQAHLYRGVALYRKQDFARAEQEFSSALNFDSGSATPDASAWRHMAAVAGGACGPSAAMLRQSLEGVSSYFPKDEAEALARKCAARSISEVVPRSTQ